jgi:hypothetical protein
VLDTATDPQLTPESQTAGLTIGRACEIERGKGLPPTDAELEEFAEVKARMQRSPYLQSVKETLRQFAVVKPVYESAPPSEKRRLGNMTVREVFALHARKLTAAPRSGSVPAFPGRARSSARASRSRSVRTSSAKARSPGSKAGDDDSSEPPLVAVPVERFRADVRRWLRGAA